MKDRIRQTQQFNPLNAELNPICHLLALLGAHHILYVSRIRINALLDPERLALGIQQHIKLLYVWVYM
jgi:hypothetical protein